jgi:two-component system CheB/CheR fusion protein
VATVFLDTSLHIRFFTPATKLLFNVIPSDIGRPLADLSSLAADGALLADARAVLSTSVPSEREIEALNGAWYGRRILPYRTQEKGVEGVVITFADITDRRRTADALAEAKRKAETANAAKSRFLAAASHDLRQPLQTLTLIQERLAQMVEGEQPRMLLARLDETLGAMSGMLNAILDINQIEAGTVHSEAVSFPVNDMFDRLRGEFTYQAQAHKLALRVVPCGLIVRSDARLLEQMVRNLLSNALKYTKQGKVLLGCRRLGDKLSIEIWDTGIGIPAHELQAIFEEYHQLDNPAREQSRGLGLGLSIVHRLGNLLGHRVHVRSRPGHGSVFAIEVEVPSDGTPLRPDGRPHGTNEQVTAEIRQAGTILIIEDEPEVRRLLGLLLKQEGHHAVTAADGPGALELVAAGTVVPDLILADYNLPGGMDGLDLTARLRAELHRQVPVIVLTGDISTGTLREIARQNCVQLNKPVKLKELTQAIRHLLPAQQPAPRPPREAVDPASTVVFVVDDDSLVRAALRGAIEEGGHAVEDYADCESFLEAYRPGRQACLLVDAYLPGMTGLDLLRRLHKAGDHLPAVMITGNSDVSMAVEAMKAGASDFIEKPVGGEELLASIGRALEQARDATKPPAWHEAAANRLADLTPRQRQVMERVVAGQPSKNIAADLGISRRTVENHRAAIMHKTGAKSLPGLARLALAATWDGGDRPLGQDRPAMGGEEAAGAPTA